MPGTMSLAQQPDVAAAIDVLQKWIPVHMRDNRVPGLSLGIVYDQELIWARGFGFADLDTQTPATTKTLYRIASHTKMFTAAAIMQLRDAGKLSLDDPIENYLPWFEIQYRDDMQGDQPPRTIRQLLTHTAGLPRDSVLPAWAESRFPTWEQVRENTPKRDAALLSDVQLKYSNLGYVLLGGVIEALAGVSCGEYIEKHILQPLGMDATKVMPSENLEGLATGYLSPTPDGSRESADYSDVRGFMAAAGFASNIEDLARFVMLQFRDEPPTANPVLRGGTIREMHRVQWVEPDWKSGWGLGLSIWSSENRTLAGHGGGLKGYITQTTWCRADKIGVTALTNALNGSPGSYVDQVFKLVAPPILQAAQSPEPEASSDWEQYVGVYHSTWGFDVYVTVEKNKLVARSLSWIDEPATILEPVKGHVFRALSGGTVGELYRFEVDETGAVTRMYSAGDYVERVE